MEIEALGTLRELTNVLRDGGAYAGWALFILLWGLERHYNRRSTKEFGQMAMAQIEAATEMRMTLLAVKDGLHGVEYELDHAKQRLQTLDTTVQRLGAGREVV